MTIHRIVRIVAGSFILLSLALAHANGQADLTSLSWLWFTVFVGANLLQSGITRWCLMESLLRRLGVPEQEKSS